MKGRTLLILDFDGVICDSTDECVVTAWNAWCLRTGIADSARVAEQVPEPYRSGLRSLRSYARTAGEYLVLIEAIHDLRSICSQSDFEASLQCNPADIADFAVRFFAARNELRQDLKHWISLHRIYDGIPLALNKWKDQTELFIVTGKDQESVQILFDEFGLRLDSRRILDRNAARDKLGAIRSIAESLELPLEATVFLDDNIQHLLPAHFAGCRCLLAGWGYHTDEDLMLADRQGVQVIALQFLESEIERLLS